jgi:hypothetical protein
MFSDINMAWPRCFASSFCKRFQLALGRVHAESGTACMCHNNRDLHVWIRILIKNRRPADHSAATAAPCFTPNRTGAILGQLD